MFFCLPLFCLCPPSSVVWARGTHAWMRSGVVLPANAKRSERRAVEVFDRAFALFCVIPSCEGVCSIMKGESYGIVIFDL